MKKLSLNYHFVFTPITLIEIVLRISLFKTNEKND